jgi:hypothetical protein
MLKRTLLHTRIYFLQSEDEYCRTNIGRNIRVPRHFRAIIDLLGPDQAGSLQIHVRLKDGRSTALPSGTIRIKLEKSPVDYDKGFTRSAKTCTHSQRINQCPSI